MKLRNVIPAPGGVPPGKTLAWVKNRDGAVIYGYVIYDTLAEAMQDVGVLLMESEGHAVVVNSKDADESFLHVFELKKIASWPKQEPFDWSKSKLNPRNWF